MNLILLKFFSKRRHVPVEDPAFAFGDVLQRFLDEAGLGFGTFGPR
jgi:hypothetical protein